jgi:hypothetical protein
MGDHSESVQLDFDPGQITYEMLLNIFWRNHEPTRRAWSRQYMSAIFYHDEQQYRLALESKAREEKKRNRKIHTRILPLKQFYLAEEYHQKYQLRQHPDLMREFKAIYPRDIDFINSTAAARVNGYIGGNGSIKELKDNIQDLGLSSGSQQRLLDYANRFNN